jgi:ATP/maltotriose-dependent transcriptional regulator MalT
MLPLFTPEYLQGISTFTLRYFENLFSRFKAPYVLVFDNYHSVAVDSNFHNTISDGLSTVPNDMNVIIVSRHDIPPALSRLHASGLIGVLGWDELRLRPGETGGIVRLRERGKTPKDIIRRLHDATDGWAAGLVLMLESLKRGTEPHLLGKLARGEIVDYFGNEIFSKIDREMQDFLLQTAFLPRMTAKMAERLTGLPNAGKILSTLVRTMILQEHHAAEPVYQYHQLFREFLLFRAKESYSSAILSDLQHRAAVLLEEAGQIEAAISLLRDLGDWDEMVRLIMKQAPSMLEQGRYRTLEEWLDSLPKEMLENDPWLLYWKGASQFPFHPSIAHPYFEKAFDRFKIRGNLEGVLLGWSGVVDSIVWTMKDFSLLDRWIQKLPELPENPEESFSPEVWIRTLSSMIIALAYRPRERSKTEEWVRRAASLMQGPDRSFGKVPIIFNLFLYYLFTGDFEQLSIAARSLQQLAQSQKAVPLVVIMARMAEMTFYQSIGDYEKCLKRITDGLKTSEDTGILFAINILIGNAILIYQNSGDLEMAQSMLERVASSLDRQAPYEKGFYHLCQARQFLLCSELALRVRRMAETASNAGHITTWSDSPVGSSGHYRIGRHEADSSSGSCIAERLSSQFLNTVAS